MSLDKLVRARPGRPRTFSRRVLSRMAPRTLSLAAVAAILLLGAPVPMPAAIAHASNTYAVTTTLDEDDAGACAGAPSGAGADGVLSLREAICEANNAGGAQTISVPPGTYNLTNVGIAELEVGSTSGADITIQGSGPASTIIHQTTPNQRVFNLDFNAAGNVTVNLSDLTITGGTGTTYGGGGILAGWTGDNTTLDHVVISGNSTSGGNEGGGISYGGGGNLTITNSSIVNNSSDLLGGGIAFNQSSNTGDLTITNSIISTNTVTNTTGGLGGGLAVTGNNTVTIDNSTFTNNTLVGGATVNQHGGAVEIEGGTLNARFNRITGNSAGNGSGLYVAAGATANAANNWWGCNGGPGAPGCDDTQGRGTITTEPYLKLTLAADAASVNSNASTGVHASTTINSNGQDTSSTGTITDSPTTPNVTFSGTLGVVSPGSAGLVAGVASSTYTAGGTGGVGSASATLDNATASVSITVNTPPSITTQPSDQIACAGSNVTFTSAAGGNPAPSVQWQVSSDGGASFSPSGGQTSPTLSFTSNPSQDGNQYEAVYSNVAGTATTNPATLVVQTGPSATLNPSDLTVNAGQTASFTATAAGNPAPSVQWQVSADGGSTFNDINGATSPVLSFTASTGQNGNQYRAVFTNAGGTATTTPATLTVNAPTPTPTQTATDTATATPTGTATITATATRTPTSNPGAATATSTETTPPVTPSAAPSATASATPAPAYTPRLYFAGGVSTTTQPAFINLLNPGLATAHLRITFLFTGGAVRDTFVSVPPTTECTVRVSSLTSLQGAFGLVVASDQSIAAQLTLTRPGRDGDIQSGSPRPQRKWYLAEGYTGQTFHEAVTILNPDPMHGATVTLRLLPQGAGHPARTRTVFVAAHDEAIVDINQVMPRQAVSIIAGSTAPVVVERTVSFGPRAYGLTTRLGASAAATTWYFAEGTTTRPFQTFFTILNPGDHPAHVTLRFYGHGGSLMARRVIIAGPRQRTTLRLDSVVRASEIANIVTSDVPVVVERPEYFGDPNAAGVSGAVGFGLPTAQSRWWFAGGETTGASEYLLLFNPGRRATSARVMVVGGDGRTYSTTVDLASHERHTMEVGAAFPGLTGTRGETVTTLGGPGIVAEQTVFARDYSTLASTTGLAP